ncbi:2-oxoacid:acceptor oxidoreductase, delta subunit, pyruvate/2-ketoisovalerate family [Thermoplasmatales archaeon BRNA1]|nr:2-oxoacid:acceptor oxidoreductase, delta subunit, pyruvate/2-ketoisovalerate family [Thermoplasmatales archaeon BRNA1]
MVNLADYKEMIIGSRVIEPGNSEKFRTGDWRSQVPVIDKSICISCLSCWIDCPDNCIVVDEDGLVDVKTTHCKGCGICSQVCPKDAITMKEDIA